MIERNALRDNTLVLRILDERLQTRLREKMAALEEKANQEFLERKKQQDANKLAQLSLGNTAIPSTAPSSSAVSSIADARILELEGVTCEPAVQSSTGAPLDSSLPSTASLLDQYTLWNFRCDGATYPARLVNLPCPVEIHKTHDHAMYYKCADIAQMLIVYEDVTALEEAESMPGYKHEAFPSYYHSGLTKPMSRVVQRRFLQREHAPVPPPMKEVMEVENYLMELIDKMSMKDPSKKVGRGGSKGPGRSMTTKVLEEIEDEVVDYEPWMDDYGRVPLGIEFDESDAICKMHPEVWLDAEECKKNNVTVRGDDVDTAKSNTEETKKKKKKKKASVDDTSSLVTDTGATTPSATSLSKPKTQDKKVKKKKKEAAIHRSSTAPSPMMEAMNLTEEASEIIRPSSTPLNLDADNMDGFDFNLEDLGDDDFDMDAIAD